MQLSLHRLAAPACRLTHDERLVIEDSAGGIKAAVAAGMTVFGFCAASHIREGHHLKLRCAGAVHLAHSWSDVERFALHFFNG
jgi:beta-phosphoglucomutase-like phosphatase (HAD superfamily)